MNMLPPANDNAPSAPKPPRPPAAARVTLGTVGFTSDAMLHLPGRPSKKTSVFMPLSLKQRRAVSKFVRTKFVPRNQEIRKAG